MLHDVSFRIEAGEFAVLLGPNGAGKTTLFALITRLYHAQHGRVRVFGQDFRSDPSAALEATGVVFQLPTLDLDLSVIQNLRYAASLHGMPARRARERIEAELERSGLGGRRRDRARALSGGQRRRLELARALLHEPRLLLLDEPTAGLDLESRGLLLAHVRLLCRERGMAALWATHLIEEAARDAHVIVLHRGRVLADGNAGDLVEREGTADLSAAFAGLTRA